MDYPSKRWCVFCPESESIESFDTKEEAVEQYETDREDFPDCRYFVMEVHLKWDAAEGESRGSA